jgi:hypothetical protein
MLLCFVVCKNGPEPLLFYSAIQGPQNVQGHLFPLNSSRILLLSLIFSLLVSSAVTTSFCFMSTYCFWICHLKCMCNTRPALPLRSRSQVLWLFIYLSGAEDWAPGLMHAQNMLYHGPTPSAPVYSSTHQAWPLLLQPHPQCWHLLSLPASALPCVPYIAFSPLIQVEYQEEILFSFLVLQQRCSMEGLENKI